MRDSITVSSAWAAQHGLSEETLHSLFRIPALEMAVPGDYGRCPSCHNDDQNFSLIRSHPSPHVDACRRYVGCVCGAWYYDDPTQASPPSCQDLETVNLPRCGPAWT
jgi:hypothetical protein